MPDSSSDAETMHEQLRGTSSQPSPQLAGESRSEPGPSDRSGTAPPGVPPDGTKQGQGEAPIGVWNAVRSSLLLVIITIVVFAAAGVAAAYVRPQKYSATTRLAVLHVNFGSPGALSGFSSGAPVLADTYARAVTADGVIDPLAAQLHTAPATIRGELAAAAIPQSPVLGVTATTGSGPSAIALANAASAQLIKYLQVVNSSNPDAAKLLKVSRRRRSA